jgi:hypothetical protein
MHEGLCAPGSTWGVFQVMMAFQGLSLLVCCWPLFLRQALMALAPETAVVVELDEDNRVLSEQTISSRLVHHGDLLKVGAVCWRGGGARRM